MVDAEHAEQHEGPSLRDYLIVFGVLAVCTTVSFVTNAIFGIGSLIGLTIIMSVSIVKATLVAMFFMHLKWDWTKVFVVMVPVMILTVMTIICLLPDTVMSRLEPSGPPGYVVDASQLLEE